MTAVLVQQAVKPRRLVSFHRMIKSVAKRFGPQAAVNWTKAVLGHQAKLNERALATAIASGKVERIAAVVKPLQLQQALGQSMQGPLTKAAQTAGSTSTAILRSKGLQASFNMVHPNVVLFARKQSAQLVVGVPAETRAVIAEVIAMGAERGLTVVQQARAIRETVGLPPNWVTAPANLADEIRNGQAAAATGRRMSARLKQQIRSRIANGTVDDAFIRQAVSEYTASLIGRRALTIAHTESLRSAHHGLTESWKQAQDQGVLPDTVRRFWIVTPDSRLSEEHAQIPGMNPQGRELEEMFLTTEGEVMYPPSRPNCRCSVGLVINPRGGRVVEPEAPPPPPASPVSVTPAPDLDTLGDSDIPAPLDDEQFQDILRGLRPAEDEPAGIPPRSEPEPPSGDALVEAFGGPLLEGRPLEQHLDTRQADFRFNYRDENAGEISRPEYNAITSYQNGGYGRINEQLREGHDWQRGEIIENLDLAIGRAPALTESGVFWRGGELPPGVEVGDTFRDKGFVSISTERSVAESFARDSNDNSVIRMGVEEGQRGLWMKTAINDGGESEFLLPRGTSFQVLSVRDFNKDQYIETFGHVRTSIFDQRPVVRVYDVIVRQRGE